MTSVAPRYDLGCPLVAPGRLSRVIIRHLARLTIRLLCRDGCGLADRLLVRDRDLDRTPHRRWWRVVLGGQLLRLSEPRTRWRRRSIGRCRRGTGRGSPACVSPPGGTGMPQIMAGVRGAPGRAVACDLQIGTGARL